MHALILAALTTGDTRGARTAHRSLLTAWEESRAQRKIRPIPVPSDLAKPVAEMIKKAASK